MGRTHDGTAGANHDGTAGANLYFIFCHQATVEEFTRQRTLPKSANPTIAEYRELLREALVGVSE